MNFKIGIVGGGAAGMIAAWAASNSSPDSSVSLFEKNNSLGAKVVISGGGRCNLTTGIERVSDVLKNYPRGARFLKHSVYSFDPVMVRNFFEDLGVPTKCEADFRVFPVSNDGKDVVSAFESFFAKSSVKVNLGSGVADVKLVNSNEGGQRFELIDKFGESLGVFDKLILTTGGQAYRHTGSTGDGYYFAEKFGHSVTKLGPSLNSFILDESWLCELSGVSLKNVTLSAKNSEQKKCSKSGPILITHKGISGPCVFALSADLSFTEFDKNKPLVVRVDFLSTYSLADMVLAFEEFLQNSPKKFVKHFLYEFFPKSLAEALALRFGVDINAPVDSLSSKSVKLFFERVKNCDLSLVGRGKGDEFVTAGGVCRNEIDPKTMQSRLVNGLFFAGEIVDVDGVTGGFNLQASWATGKLAGESAVMDLDSEMLI